MKKSVRLYIDGTVQGVFFRSFIKTNAERCNVKGFTRNLENGKVEVFLEGDANDVNKMIDLCKKGRVLIYPCISFPTFMTFQPRVFMY